MANPSKQNCLNADKDHQEIIYTQQTNVADAVVAHEIVDTNGDFAAPLEAELEGFYDALGVKINAALLVIEKHGLMAGTSAPAPGNCCIADINNKGILSTQSANVADAVVAHSIADAGGELDAANETELEGFYDALGTQINALLAVLEAQGLMAGTGPEKQDCLYADKDQEPMVTTQSSLVADAETSHSITDTATEIHADLELELEGFYDALGVKINAALDVLEANGIMADA